LLQVALQAAETLDASVANMRFVKPLDLALVRELADKHEYLVTLEENTIIGGAGAEVARALEGMGISKRLLRLGLPDSFIEHGEQGEMLADIGLNAANLIERINMFKQSIT
jgi:1-deoxy-D-xylulose-5-phosphate synthase